jgi:hypothetical protein
VASTHQAWRRCDPGAAYRLGEGLPHRSRQPFKIAMSSRSPNRDRPWTTSWQQPTQTYPRSTAALTYKSYKAKLSHQAASNVT